MATIPIQFGSSILDEVENVYDDVTRKAYEKFISRGRVGVLDIDDWLEAEREILMKPEARLIEKRRHFIVRLHLPRVDPSDVRILATQDDLVVQSSSRYAGARLFKTVHFPEKIDLRRVRSSWIGEKLVVLALKLNPAFEDKREPSASEG
jgi:HSP20 family molecular chaperone IbpA